MEEGEIIDEDVDDLYTPLKRPSEPEPSHRSMEQDSEPSEESESNDSDDSQRGQKKPKLKPSLLKNRPMPDKSKKYNIWCSGIQEEVLTQELTNCEVAQRYEKTRDVESYDYTMFHSNEGEEARNIPPQVSNKRQHGERQNRGIRARLGRRRSSDDSMRGAPRAMLELSVTVENTDEEVAKDIANKLCEQKEELILRSVQVLGKAKAIELFRLTRKIEEGGGMLVMNQTRRRTPGGVFLFHVKSDSTQEQSEQIFTEDRKHFDTQRRLERSRQRRERARAMQHTLEQGNQLALPASPLGAEPLSCEEEEPGGSNPPPSPVTDGRADSSPESCPKPPMPHQIAAAAAATAARQQQQAHSERNLVTYDDFLDLNASFEMDV